MHVFRVHPQRLRGRQFNATVRDPESPVVEGGRFDTVTGAYAYLYAARQEGGAFAEAFAQDLDYAVAGPRPLPRSRVAQRAISVVAIPRVRLVSLDGAGAEQLGQDGWLTSCDASGYGLCREWAEAIRVWAPAADGLLWHSRRDPRQEVFMLWGEPLQARSGCGLIEREIRSEDLTRGAAALRLKAFLVQWRLYIEP